MIQRPQARLPISGGRWGGRDWLVAPLLMIAVLAVYHPAWRGRLIWDDDRHVTSPELRSGHGLWQIWFELGATQQYYPLTHSVFWIEQTLWGDEPLGYHLLNIALHGLAAVLVWRILRCLDVPGAFWAAAIFALHPLQVESVAWISELKNTLSTVFCLAALLAYLSFDRTRRISWYVLALGLFGLALLSKTVTAVLPPALLVILWWQRGRLAWRRDVLPLVPWLLLGAAAGGLTAWVERKLIRAEGAEFDFSFLERLLIAGRAVWFYLGKLFWPADLIFTYPRWLIHQAGFWQYLFPLSALTVLLTLWLLRRRARAPLAAALCYVGALFPALGFFNVYPFRYSFVADHFQYLASLAIIVPVVGGVTWFFRQGGRLWRLTGRMLGFSLLTLLAVLSWQQSRMYADLETLYRTTIARNPDCWLAYYNLGVVLSKAKQMPAAVECYKQTLRLVPRYAEAHNNLGMALGQQGDLTEALEQLRQAVEIRPDFAEAHSNLASLLLPAGHVLEAREHYQRALELRPDSADAHNGLGNVLLRLGQTSAAVDEYQRAVQLDRNYAEAQYNLATALLTLGRNSAAVAQFQRALRLSPALAEAHNNLGTALLNLRRNAEAIEQYRQATTLRPDYAEAHFNCGSALAGIGKVHEAIEQYERALRCADATGPASLAGAIRARLKEYRAGQP